MLQASEPYTMKCGKSVSYITTKDDTKTTRNHIFFFYAFCEKRLSHFFPSNIQVVIHFSFILCTSHYNTERDDTFLSVELWYAHPGGLPWIKRHPGSQAFPGDRRSWHGPRPHGWHIPVISGPQDPGAWTGLGNISRKEMPQESLVQINSSCE